MNTVLLIFSLISLIILIPIIYFLPLKLTLKGKITVIAISFLIAIAGLLTKVFMQLWQSILLLVGLILLLSMILTKKYSPELFPVSEATVDGKDGFKSEMKKKPPDHFGLQSISEIPGKNTYESLDINNGQKDAEKTSAPAHFDEMQDMYVKKESDHVGKYANDIENSDEAVYPSEASLWHTAEINPELPESEAIGLNELHVLEELETLSPSAVELDSEQENENTAVPLQKHDGYLAELEDLMLTEQSESAVAAEADDRPLSKVETEAETDVLIEVKPELISDTDEEDDIAQVRLEDIEERNFSPFDEQLPQLETLAENQTKIQEENAEPIWQVQTEAAEAKGHKFERQEVLDTLLLQIEIAKRMHDRKQFEQIVESFLNYDDLDDERYKLMKTLLKDFINIMKE